MSFGPRTPRSVQTPAALPPMPTVADPVVAEEARRKRIAERNAGGVASTILTSSQGVKGENKKKTTLGGG